MPQFRREPLVERIRRVFSDKLIDFAEHLPEVKRGVLFHLQQIRRESRFTNNARPQSIGLDFDSLWVCEILTIEEFERQIPRLMCLLESHRSKRFLTGFHLKHDLLSYLRSIKDNVHGTGWKNLNRIDFKEVKKSQFVDYIEASLMYYSGGHIVFIFQLYPTKHFINELRCIIDREYPPRCMLQFPNRKNLFGFWGYQTFPGETAKCEEIQKLIVEFKSEARNQLRRYIKGRFFEAKKMIPSIELWMKNEQTIQPVKNDDEKINEDEGQERKQHYESFWYSVDLPVRALEKFSEESDACSLYLPDRKSNDFSIKILVDKQQIKPEARYKDIESQISSRFSSVAHDLMPIWGLRACMIDFIDMMTDRRLKIFSKKRPSVRFLFKHVREISNHRHNYNRLKKDMLSEDLFRDIGFNNFYQSYRPDSKFSLTKSLSKNMNYLAGKANELFVSTEEFLNSLIGTVTIRTNYTTQRWVVFLSVIMVIVGALSLVSNSKLCDLKKVRLLCDRAVSFLNEETIEKNN